MRRFHLVLMLGLVGCGEAATDSAVADTVEPADLTESPDLAAVVPVEVGTWPRFELTIDTKAVGNFYAQPWPGDWRVTADGRQDLRGYPFVSDALVGADLVAMAGTEHGFPVISAAYFLFSGPLATLTPTDILPATVDQPFMLIDIDPDSKSRGRLIPLVAETLVADGWTPENLLGLAPRPGFVLEPGTRYAYVIRKALLDKVGQPLSASKAFAALAAGEPVEGDQEGKVAAMFAPLFETLETLGVGRQDVAGATVFTTGDVVRELADLSTALKDKYQVEIKDLAIDPEDGATHERFCEIHGTVTLPQFQYGAPPYNTDGLFDESAGLPKLQREETAPLVITLPKDTPMPEGGYPLVIYFHGSGNLSSEVVDRGKVETPDGPPRTGEGPAYVLAPHGFAAAGFALPLNPQRFPGAGDTAYLNVGNPKALRDTFRQGAIEARLVIEALSKQSIPKEVVAACGAPTLSAGQDSFRVDVEPLFAMGNSMGGMYANIVGAIEPRVQALAPSGAGGFWTYFILDNPYQPVKDIIGPAFFSTSVPLTLLHPAIHLAQDVLGPADPLNYVPRLGHRPLAGHPARSVFEPVGKDDKYFPTTLFDAIALGYGNEQAGEAQWATMQEALTRAGHGGLKSFPVVDNLESVDGQKYTGVVVQYTGTGESDPHSIISQLDSVKFQYGCFLETARDRGKAVLPAPLPLGTTCPTEP